MTQRGLRLFYWNSGVKICSVVGRASSRVPWCLLLHPHWLVRDIAITEEEWLKMGWDPA